MGGACCSNEDPGKGKVKVDTAEPDFNSSAEPSKSKSKSKSKSSHSKSSRKLGEPELVPSDTEEDPLMSFRKHGVREITGSSRRLRTDTLFDGHQDLTTIYDSDDDDDDMEKLPRASKAEIMTGIKDSIVGGDVGLLHHWCGRAATDLPLMVDASEEFGATEMSALMFAIMSRRVECVSFLLTEASKVQAAVDFQNSDGNTAVHLAVQAKNAALLGVLVHGGADKKIKNNAGKTPLDLCKEIGDPYEIHELIEPYAPRASSFPMQRMESLYRVDDDMYEVEDDSDEEDKERIRKLESMAMQKEVASSTMLRQQQIGRPGHLAVAKIQYAEASRSSVMATKSLVASLAAAAGMEAASSGIPGGRPSLTPSDSSSGADKLAAINLERSKLPKLEGMLEKKHQHRPQYQKRWTILREGYLLWHKKKRELEDVHDPDQRKKFSNSVYLLHLHEVSIVDTKSRNKFQFCCYNPISKKPDKQYVFRCDTSESCEEWVSAIEKHHKCLKEMTQYLKKGGV